MGLIQGLAVALALSALANFAQHSRVQSLRLQIAADRQRITDVALTYAQNARAVEADHNRRVHDAQRNREAALQAQRLVADSLRGELDGMRAAAASFAAGPADDSLAACRDRAAAASDLLVRVLQAGARSTGAAEVHSTDVRALREAWPVNPAASAAHQ